MIRGLKRRIRKLRQDAKTATYPKLFAWEAHDVRAWIERTIKKFKKRDERREE